MRLIIAAALATTLISSALADPKGPWDTGDSWGPYNPISRTQQQWAFYTEGTGGAIGEGGDQAEDGSYPADIIPFDLAVQSNANEFDNPMGSKGD